MVNQLSTAIAAIAINSMAVNTDDLLWQCFLELFISAIFHNDIQTIMCHSTVAALCQP